MSNSSLVNYMKISPNKNSPKKYPITKITLHHVAGNLSVETLGNVFASASRQASSNYGVDGKGRVGMYVEEKDRSWCSSNADNDHRAVTIEIANDGGAPLWHVSDTALNKTIELCIDICKRNGIKKLLYDGTKNGTLTLHNMFAATACPGPYLTSKISHICAQVNARIAAPAASDDALYRVQVGAFKIPAGADETIRKLRAKGYDTLLVVDGGLHKVQTGAFKSKANAVALAATLKKEGFETYISEGEATISAAKPSAPMIKAGSRVKVKAGTKDYTGKSLADFVHNTMYTVLEISGDRVVIGIGKAVTAAVRATDLILQ